MDAGLFTERSPGFVVPLTRDPGTGNAHAFVPNDLPPTWEFSSSRLWPLLTEAKQQLGILEGIGRTLPNPGILLRPLEDREAIKSSRLEGTYVTATELLVFELQPKESKSEDDPSNQRREVSNYRKALQQASNTKLPLSLRLIRELHKTLMDGVRGQDRTPGEFRRTQVAIGTNHRFVPPPPDRLMECLGSLEKYFHKSKSKYDPLIDCLLVHYQFETIHPFTDGNGRVGRLLLALMLKEFCVLSKPWLYLSEYYEAHREEYVQRLFNVSSSGDWEGWLEFCLTGVVSQAKDTIQRCDRLQEIKATFLKKLVETGGSVRLNKIVEEIFYSPFVQVATLKDILGVSYPTAKADVERLITVGILRELNEISPKTYYSPDVFRVAYEKMD
jgi:Fic family protein